MVIILMSALGRSNAYFRNGRKGIQKAHGVDQVANFLSVKPADIIAFGDEHNDEEMLSYAGWGVVMNNATDKIKSVANDVTENK